MLPTPPNYVDRAWQSEDDDENIRRRLCASVTRCLALTMTIYLLHDAKHYVYMSVWPASRQLDVTRLYTCVCKCHRATLCSAVKATRGQSNMAKAASNAPHTLHALDSVTIDVPKICRGSQKLKGHVTQMRTRIWPTVAQFSLGSSPLYTQNFKSLALAVPEIWGKSQNVKVGPFPSLWGSGPTSNTMFHGPPRSVHPKQHLDLTYPMQPKK